MSTNKANAQEDDSNVFGSNVFNPKTITYRREVVLSSLSSLTGLEKDKIENVILGYYPRACMCFLEDGNKRVSENTIACTAERIAWRTLLIEHGVSVEDHPWVFELPTRIFDTTLKGEKASEVFKMFYAEKCMESQGFKSEAKETAAPAQVAATAPSSVPGN
ncbi:hypothetical protein F4803DRAFT_65957 [Xylaria telfairii]|nr:hypothetical protein F4803DRAFT_65957 [Xylaria telfairii]